MHAAIYDIRCDNTDSRARNDVTGPVHTHKDTADAYENRAGIRQIAELAVV